MMAEDYLATYRGKRRFVGASATREPDGGSVAVTAWRKGSGTRAGGREALLYVVQEHHASSHHFDFRLELDGTLKSWAIPKGPSEDPAVKRLAVHVEDHPIAYGSFEGTIPAGHYGAGDVSIWDKGSWEPEGGLAAAREGYRSGKLVFRLHGQRLHGSWALVRTRMRGKQAQWLLLKERESKEGTVKPRAKAAKATVANKRGRVAENWQDVWARVKPHAVRRGCPETMKPQLATLVAAAPENGTWSYEIKFDGYRILAQSRPAASKAKEGRHRGRLFTRQQNDWTAKLPEQADALRGWTEAIAKEMGGPFGGAWFDGEAVSYNETGVPDFQSLQNAFDADRSSHIVLYLFDVLYFHGYDLRDVPLFERRALLRALLADIPVPGDANATKATDLARAPASATRATASKRKAARVAYAADAVIRFSDDFDAPPAELLSHACALSLEGVIGKRIDSAYRAGRTQSWIKLKCRRRQEFVIVGFTEPTGSRRGFGALLLGVNAKDEKGRSVLRYAGRVGTGFSAAMLRSLRSSIDKLVYKGTSRRQRVIDGPVPRDAAMMHWIRPTLVAECEFSEWTRNGVLRQASFVQLRADKSAKDIVREDPQMPSHSRTILSETKRSATGGRRHLAAQQDATQKVSRKHSASSETIAGVRITHPDRVIDTHSGARKIDLVRYCEWIAPWLLLELAGRPVSLLRVPADIAGESFFQKHAPTLSIPHVMQHAKLDPGHPPLLTLDNVAALVGAAQMGTVELHTWNARVDSIEKPDRMVFDLDPGAGLSWKKMIEAAQLTRAFLEEIGLRSFCKTSGGKGLHVVVPLTRHAVWGTVRDFSQAVAQHLAGTLPEHFSAKMGEENRKGKVFVDYLRNNRGASTVAAYSLRARPGLGISIPINWDELTSIRGGDHWTLANIHERMADLADASVVENDPWHDYTKTHQLITAAMRKRLADARKGVWREAN
ncbi:DNA ligase D [Robbsia andropogonis]|uniref:DNA ligase D n=2 Tax=Robbsia andropogonis TaxID=28092 RepID=UPI0020A1C54A|nr:DNA ligase D [Robbsia andropogonis]MCP1119325.1 DNA ligase D [Robbsia andropogonis]MCP1129165.1 DNA ligase D [Robbsia andropogonis]